MTGRTMKSCFQITGDKREFWETYNAVKVSSKLVLCDFFFIKGAVARTRLCQCFGTVYRGTLACGGVLWLWCSDLICSIAGSPGNQCWRVTYLSCGQRHACSASRCKPPRWAQMPIGYRSYMLGREAWSSAACTNEPACMHAVPNPRCPERAST